MASTAAAARGARLLGEPSRIVLEIPRGCSREGTAWVIPRLVQLCAKWKPAAVAFPKNGPAAALGSEAEQAGIQVTWLSSADEAAAFALIVTAVKASPPPVAHLGRELAPGMWAAGRLGRHPGRGRRRPGLVPPHVRVRHYPGDRADRGVLGAEQEAGV